jgi:hypothetical protein
MWGGPGSGAACAVCSRPITSDEVGYEIEFHDKSGQTDRAQSIHVICFAAWEQELDAAVPEANGGSSRDGANGRHLPSTGSGGTIMGRERDRDRKGTLK